MRAHLTKAQTVKQAGAQRPRRYSSVREAQKARSTESARGCPPNNSSLWLELRRLPQFKSVVHNSY